MLNIHHILHPTDFSAGARAALHRALLLARRHDAVLHVLHVAPAFGADPLRGALDASVDEFTFERRLHNEGDAQMQAMLDAVDTEGVSVRCVQGRGNAPGAVILEYTEAEPIDLIVMGTHGRRGFREMLLGSVTQEVVRRSQCPVLTVCTPSEEQDEIRPIRRVLVPIDFSASSQQALRCAQELAVLYKARLDLLHVVGVPRNPELYDQAFPLFDEVKTGITDASLQGLQRLAKETLRPNVPASFHVRAGYPAREILLFAESHETDLIVMATHGLTGLQHFLFGSVSEKVVQRAPCPVFVVKSFGKSLLPSSDTIPGVAAGDR